MVTKYLYTLIFSTETLSLLHHHNPHLHIYVTNIIFNITYAMNLISRYSLQTCRYVVFEQTSSFRSFSSSIPSRCNSQVLSLLVSDTFCIVMYFLTCINFQKCLNIEAAIHDSNSDELIKKKNNIAMFFVK